LKPIHISPEQSRFDKVLKITSGLITGSTRAKFVARPAVFICLPKALPFVL